MIYISRTGTRENLKFARACGWRLMVSAKGVLRDEGFRYALDNGAWTASQLGKSFDEMAYLKALRALGQNADFVVLPDIVCGGMGSLDMSLSWVDRTRDVIGEEVMLLLPVQNGMRIADIANLPRQLGIFVGGDDDWKDRTTPEWAKYAHDTGRYCHVGRVNTKRRLWICATSGVDSIDGSGAARWVKHARKVHRWCSQGVLCLR